MAENPPKKPTPAQARKLLAQVDQLVLAQTNVFIRELLRDLGKKPGANKEEFRASLEDAINEGLLDKAGLDLWLRKVEGWGNQHVYAFEVPPAVAADAGWLDEKTVESVASSAFKGSWRAPISGKFPEDPELTRTDFDPGRRLFLVEWHERTDSWAREKRSDKKKTESGDRYWYKAFRLEPSRAVMRFALLLQPKVAKKPLAALFLRVPIRTKEHELALEIAWRDLQKLKFGGSPLATIQNWSWSISSLVKKLDSQIQGAKLKDFTAKTTKFAEGKASVQFVAPPDMVLPPNIKNVRLSIPKKVMDSKQFLGESGDFRMRPNAQRPTSREAHIQLFQEDSRMRILTELDESDVWTALETFDTIRRMK